MPLSSEFKNWLLATGIVLLASTAQAQPADQRLAYGVIVQLRDAANADTGRAAPLATRETPQRERERLARVFQGKSLPLGQVRPTGVSSQLVRWTRPLEPLESQRLLAELRAHSDVLWAEPNVMEKRLQAAAPDDPLFRSDQWWLSASPTTTPGSRGVPNFFEAWNVTTGGPVTVAVLDTGLVRNHPDLDDPRFAKGHDFVTDENGSAGDGDGRDPDFNDPGDWEAEGECGPGSPVQRSSWHGTRIAGQLGAITNNARGVASINRQVNVLSVRVAGKCGALVSDILDGMRWVAGLPVANVPPLPVAQRARIINLSFGSEDANCRPYQATLDQLRGLGILMVMAAGNEDDFVGRPARCNGALAVAAVNRDGFKTTYSSYGPEIGISTVGGDPAGRGSLGALAQDGGLWSTTNNGETLPADNGYGKSEGTSFSTPVVVGAASLMLSVNPALTLDQLVHGLKITARPHVTTSAFQLKTCSVASPEGRCYCTTTTCGAGLLDAARAVDYARNPDAYPPAPPFVPLPPPAPEAEAVPPSSGGGGGGALGWPWLVALGTAIVALRRRRD